MTPGPERVHAKRPVRRRTSWRKRRRIRLFFEALACLLALGGIGYSFTNYVSASPRFQIKRVTVEGAYVLDEGDILTQAGVTQVDNLILMDTAVVQERVEAMPYVATCTIQRAYPDKLIIQVQERRPVATLQVANRAFELDDTFTVLREIHPMGPHPGPLLSDVPGLEVVEVGDVLEDSVLAEAFDVWRAYTTTPLAQELTLSEIAAYSTDEILMYINELPYEIRWGRTNPFEQAERLSVLWEEKLGVLPCALYLDLRLGENIPCK